MNIVGTKMLTNCYLGGDAWLDAGLLLIPLSRLQLVKGDIIVNSRYIGIKVTYRPPLTSVDRVTYRLGYLGVPQLVEGDIQDLRANQHHLHLLKDFGLTTPSWRPRLRSPMEGLCTVTTCWEYQMRSFSLKRPTPFNHLLRISIVANKEVFLRKNINFCVSLKMSTPWETPCTAQK